MAVIGDHAVVLGGSLAGLLAARVLADCYQRVTIVERDEVSDRCESRRGVPQGRHAHVLLGRGGQVFEALFPGLLDELVQCGAPVFDYSDLAGISLSFSGHTLARSGSFTDHDPAFTPSRRLLEWRVRRRVLSIGNVELIDRSEVAGLVSNAGKDRVTGAVVCCAQSGTKRDLPADLVVDALGRGTHTPAYLDLLGYGRPTEERIDMRLTYCTQMLSIEPGTLDEVTVLVGPVPGRPIGALLLKNENDTWMFSVFAMAGRRPPAVYADMITYAAELFPESLLATLRGARPLAGVARHTVPSSIWRRYDKMSRFPAGLLVLGDAACTFNPIYGQGMTLVALEAMVLGRWLRNRDNLQPRRYFRDLAKQIGTAWQLAANGDLSLPEITGHRPLIVRASNSYVNLVLAAAENDVAVASQFWKVASLCAPPTQLLHPATMYRVARAHLHRSVAPNAVTATTS